LLVKLRRELTIARPWWEVVKEKPEAAIALFGGGGLHSSTFQLNLSRF